MKNSLIYILAFLLFSSAVCNKPTGNNGNSGTPRVRLVYGSHPLQNMDVYLPANRNEKTKVVIMVHGGGWVMGYKPDAVVTTFSGRYGWNILKPLLNAGYACVVMKYRTACYNTVPARFENNSTRYQNQMMEDIDLAINKLISKAGELKIGTNHFQLLGESGGGHTVMTYTIRQNANPVVKSAVSMFGPTDLDDDAWQKYLQSLPNVNVPPPNYFLMAGNNCNSVTNKKVQIFSSLKSYADHQTINTNGSDSLLYPLCPSRSENILKSTPIFVMHGADDALVPSSQAEKMFTALINKFGNSNCTGNDYDCRYKKKVYEKCGHGWIGGNCNKQEVMNDIVSWITHH